MKINNSCLLSFLSANGLWLNLLARSSGWEVAVPDCKLVVSRTLLPDRQLTILQETPGAAINAMAFILSGKGALSSKTGKIKPQNKLKAPILLIDREDADKLRNHLSLVYPNSCSILSRNPRTNSWSAGVYTNKLLMLSKEEKTPCLALKKAYDKLQDIPVTQAIDYNI